jgi:hypothetical protein
MAIIDNHKSVKITKAFSDEHVEMFGFFDKHGIDVEVSDDLVAFRDFLTSLPADDYPYSFDPSFEPEYGNDTTFTLMLKKGDDIIATYAGKFTRLKVFHTDFVEWCSDKGSTFQEPEKLFDDDKINSYYSSCQWVSKDHRGKKFGMMLDHLKKNICFDIFEADIQYAIHKESFKDYHLNGLHYDESKWIGTIPKGEVGGAGEKKDKVYNVTWITKESWLNKQDDVRKLYTS